VGLEPASSQTKVNICWSTSNYTSGGHSHPHNPQARLSLKFRQSVNITVEVKGYDTGLQFFVYKADRHLIDLSGRDSVAASDYLASTTITKECTLDAGAYVIFCCLCNGELPRDYHGSITVSAGSLSLLRPNGPLVARSHLSGEGNGGPLNMCSPQFFLTLGVETKVSITLKIHHGKAGLGIQFTVAQVSEVRRHASSWGQSDKFFFASTNSSFLVTTSLTESPPQPFSSGVYLILPCTHAALTSECAVEVMVATESDPYATLTVLEYAPPAEHPTVPLSTVVPALVPNGQRINPWSCELFEESVACQCVDTIRNLATQGPKHVFLDDSFPANDVSLTAPEGGTHSILGIAEKWERPSTFCDSPKLFSDGHDVQDVLQGRIGDCWFCGCIAAVASKPQLVQAIFYPPSYCAEGVYAVTLCYDGCRRSVIIDDLLPVRNHRLVFGHSSDPNELWFALVEKAMAKLLGGYYALVGGYPGSAWVAPAYILKLFAGGKASALSTSDASWLDHVTDCLSEGGLVSAGSFTDQAPENEVVNSSGIVQDHAYTVISFVKHQQLTLLQLRNTWGGVEWKGRWSDEDKDSWDANPELRQQCQLKAGEDGVFWMSATDFEQNYQQLNLCEVLHNEFPHEAFIECDFPEGACTDAGNIASNAQIFLRMAKEGPKLYVTLRRIDFCELCGLRFLILDSPESLAQDSQPVFASSQNPLFSSAYMVSGMIEGAANVPGTAGKTFVIVPLLERDVPGARFTLTVYSDTEILKLQRQPCPKLIWAKGSFSDQESETVYGNQHCPTFLLLIRGSSSVPVAACITIENDKPSSVMGLMLLVSKRGESSGGWPSQEDIVAQSEYQASLTVSALAESMEPGEYRITVCRDRACAANFSICVTTSEEAAVDLTAL
jgi:hypothetical protein